MTIDRAEVRARLLRWYDANARALPWRGARDPYAIWVSEVMLQQTRVETVIGYYDRFLARFPDLRSLAAADEDEVLAAWSGLGYYRRARLLHQGVREVVARYGGRVPEDVEARRELPGVGRYTAGAIGSIAFGRPEPIVDGNVARVLARLFAIETPLGRRETEQRLWSEAEALVDRERPGDLNQALMELGATVCLPARPQCDRCPIREQCRAHAEERTAELPRPKLRRAPLTEARVAVLAREGEAVWMLPERGERFSGLWGLPSSIGSTLRDARRALTEAGLEGTLSRRAIARLEHVLTHRRLEVRVYRATITATITPASGAAAKLLGPGDLDRRGISRLTRRILEAAR